jgi:hypothetical protein
MSSRQPRRDYRPQYTPYQREHGYYRHYPSGVLLTREGSIPVEHLYPGFSDPKEAAAYQSKLYPPLSVPRLSRRDPKFLENFRREYKASYN